MDHVLSFFSDLILFTAGLVVVVLWIVVFMVIAIEVHDGIFGEPDKKTEDES